MKLSMFIVSFLAITVTITSARDDEDIPQVKDPPSFAKTPVKLKVKCKGLDFTKLSIAEDTMAGKILENTYNSIHADTEDDDGNLSGLTYRPSDPDAMFLSDPTPTEETENLKAYSRNWWRTYSRYSWWTGTWDCTHFSCNDDRRLLKTSKTSSTTKAWQNQFVAELLKSGHGPFSKVKSCEIEMHPASKQGGSIPNVDVKLQCDKHDWSKLSIAKGTFLAHAVQSSYNKINVDTANTDGTMEGLFYHAPNKKSTLTSGEYTETNTNSFLPSFMMLSKSHKEKYYLSGFWDCSECIDKDENNAAWAAEVLVLLNEGPYDDFHNVKSCEIDMIPHSLKLNGENDCALRGGCNIEEN